MSGNLKVITKENFKETIQKGTVLVDFYADWCGPCRMMTPILEKVASELGDKVNVVKIDIEANQESAAEYKVTSIPTLVLFKDGKEVNRLVGLKDENAIKQLIG